LVGENALALRLRPWFVASHFMPVGKEFDNPDPYPCPFLFLPFHPFVQFAPAPAIVLVFASNLAIPYYSYGHLGMQRGTGCR